MKENNVIGNTTLYLGDCLKVLPTLPDKSVDCIIADLPYGTTACKWDVIIPFEPMWEQFKRICKPKSPIVLFGSEPFSTLLRSSNLSAFKYDWIWEKSKAANFLQASYMPLKAHEIISVFCFDGKTKYIPQGSHGKPYNKGFRKNDNGIATQCFGKITNCGKYEIENQSGIRKPRSVQYFKTAESEGKVYHTSQKPIALLEYLIKTYSNEGDTILDCTMGSGSTMVACANTNRKGIGIELMSEYYDIAVKRVKDATVQPRLAI